MQAASPALRLPSPGYAIPMARLPAPQPPVSLATLAFRSQFGEVMPPPSLGPERVI